MDRGTLISPIIIQILIFMPGCCFWGPAMATSLIYFLMADILKENPGCVAPSKPPGEDKWPEWEASSE